jgi:hypothetical protein
MARIRIQAGGLHVHPGAAQAASIIPWLAGHQVETIEGADAFLGLEDVGLLVLNGLWWTGSCAPWAGNLVYRSPGPEHRRGFAQYLARGGSLLSLHGAVAAFDDWPDFAAGCGVAWVWGTSAHSKYGSQTVTVEAGHPITAGLPSSFAIDDEIYHTLRIAEDMQPLAHAPCDGVRHPVLLVGAGPGGGRRAYLALGHDMNSYACPELPRLWPQLVGWLVGSKP